MLTNFSNVHAQEVLLLSDSNVALGHYMDRGEDAKSANIFKFFSALRIDGKDLTHPSPLRSFHQRLAFIW